MIPFTQLMGLALSLYERLGVLAPHILFLVSHVFYCAIKELCVVVTGPDFLTEIWSSFPM